MKNVPIVVVRRLPRYYRYLTELKNNGITRISSSSLAERMGVTASQIRQDLNCFGGFGQQGYGYNVEQLQNAIGEILGLNKNYKSIIIGAGNLGRALANYQGFEKRGFRICGIFDIDPKIIGRTVSGLTVRNFEEVEEFCAEHKPEIAVLAIPKENAQAVAERLKNCGIKGLWNFTHTDINVPGLSVENVHLVDSLMTLSYKIT